MDAAETWLQQHDPAYLKSRQDWKDLDENGDYVTPWQEIPAGLGGELEALVELGEGSYLETPPARYCERCGNEFVASDEKRRYCNERCRNADKQARHRRRRAA